MKIEAILTDIEGTTSSLSFVKEVLFPYAADHLPAFVRWHRDEPRVAEWLADARREAGLDPAAREDEIVSVLLDWMASDRKVTPLKALQGLIWEQGYASGDFHGHLYPDVAPCLRAWQAAGIALYVYSSGSARAQRLLFAHTPDGDLTPLFSGFFDTRTGGKRDSTSYARILERIGRAPAAVLFLSDAREELDAAATAGLRTLALRREGVVDTFRDHPSVIDFNEVADFLA